MRQTQNETSALVPFPFSRADELIDDTLGVVGAVRDVQLVLWKEQGNKQITELSFPDDQQRRVDQGVAKLETKSTKFRQMRVADHEVSLFI